MSTSVESNVTCEQAASLMDDLYGRPEAEIPRHVADHLAECERCRHLHQWMRDEALQEGVDPELESRLCSRLRASLKPVRPLPSSSVLCSRFLLIFAALAAVLLFYYGLRGSETMSPPQIVIVSSIFVFAAIFLSISLSWQMVPGKNQRVPAPLLITTFWAGFLIVCAALFPWDKPVEPFGAGWVCTYHGLIFAAPVGALLLLLAARGAPLSYTTLGASLGATSGVFALTVLQFSCGNHYAGHLIFWHGGVVAICILVGYLGGRLIETMLARRSGQFEQ